MISDEIKSLLGEDTISEETASKLAEMLDKHIQAKLQEKEEEKAKEQEEKDKEQEEKDKEKDSEIEDLKKDKEDKEKEIESLKESIEEIKQQADAHIEDVKSSVDERIQESVSQAVAQFTEENKSLFEQLDQFNRMKDAFSLVQEAFEKNGFVLNENIELDNAKKELQESVVSYDKLFEDFETVTEELKNANYEITFRNATDSLTESQKEKVKTLSEDVSFNDIEEYSKVLSLIVEQVSKQNQNEVKKEKLQENATPVSSKMKSYLDFLK